MENRSHALIAGLFTLLLGLATLAALYWFGERREETRPFVVVTRQNVGGLNPEAQVRYRGIRVGKVRDIRLDPENPANILILAEVRRDIPLTRGTTARLAYQGVTGIAHVLLEDTGKDGTPLAGDLPRIAMQPSMMDNLENAVPELLGQVRLLLRNTNDVLNDDNRRRLGVTLDQLVKASTRANAVLAQTEKLLADDNITALAAAARQAGPLAAETRQLVQQLTHLSGRIEGVLGPTAAASGDSLVPRLKEMSGELSATSRQLRQLLQLLEDAPQSLVFGAPPAPPGPGESGFTPPVRP